jgi:hypothetical protein
MALASCTEIAVEFDDVYSRWEKHEIDTGLAIGMFQSLVVAYELARPAVTREHDMLASSRMFATVNKFSASWPARADEEYARKDIGEQQSKLLCSIL